MSEVVATGAEAPAPAPTIDVAPPPVGATPETNTPPEPPTLDDTLSAAWDKAQTGVERGEGGKFVGKAAEAPAETDSTVQPPAEAIEPEAPKVPAIEPPQSWTAEARAHWAKLPPEAQTYIAQRESEAHKAITSYGERLKSFEPLDQLIAHHKDDFARRGLQPAQAFATLLQAQKTLDANPIDGLIGIGLTYGIDLRPLLAGQQGALPAADPRVGQVSQELTQLKQQIERQQQTLEQQQQAEADAALREFAKDKPYFQDVRKLMSSFLKDEHAKTLQEAYDMAVNASPSVRARIQADQRAETEAKRAADEKKKADEAARKAAEAKKSAVVNVRSTPANKSTPRSMDDTIEEIARRAYG